MWNDSDVCGGRVKMKRIVRLWCDMWKSLERESLVVFSIPLMWSKDTLCVKPSDMELSVDANMCEPCPHCRVVI